MELQQILSKFSEMEKSGDKYKVKCPAHDDNNPSLSIWEDSDGYIGINCSAGCQQHSILSKLTLIKKDLVTKKASFDYSSNNKNKTTNDVSMLKKIDIRNNSNSSISDNISTNKPKKNVLGEFIYYDENGNYSYECIKLVNKNFMFGYINENKNWINGIKDKDLVLYNLPNVINAIQNKQTIYIVEGEKDVDSLAKIGLVATTTPFGASRINNKNKISEHIQKTFEGAIKVVFIPGYDKAGYKYALNFYHIIKNDIKQIEFGCFVDIKPEKYDVSDLIKDNNITNSIKLINQLTYLEYDIFLECAISRYNLGSQFQILKSNEKDNEKEIQLIQFWEEIPNKKETTYKINDYKFYKFLNEMGFYYILDYKKDYELVKISNKIIFKANKANIIFDIRKYITELDYTNIILNKVILINTIIKKIKYLLENERNQFGIDMYKNIEYLKSDNKTSYMFFENVYIEISNKNILLKDYNELQKYINSENIIKHNFKFIDYYKYENKKQLQKHDFYKFLKNICSDRGNKKVFFDVKLFCNLIVSLGYACDGYKSKSCAKLLYITEEQIDTNANGRVGKGILVQSLNKIRKILKIDGKRVDFKNNFLLNELNTDTNLIVFEDIYQNFDCSVLYSMLTEGIQAQKKNKDSLYIDYNDSPKFIITSNYGIQMKGESDKGRIHNIILKHYYNANYTPSMEFKKEFFNEWSEQEYNEFFNLVVIILHYYKIYFYYRKKLYENPSTLTQKLLNLNLSKEFILFSEKIEFEKVYIYSELYNDFLISNNLLQPKFSKKKFTRELKILSKFYQYEYQIITGAKKDSTKNKVTSVKKVVFNKINLPIL